jgi:hypothetical protein
MQPWLTASSILVLLAQLPGCGNSADDPLPAVQRPALFQEPQACVPVPPTQDWLPEDKPSDPRSCLSPPWHGRGLPVVLTIVNGRVTNFEFYDQCSGRHFSVAASVRECIGKSFATWRYPVLTVCSEQESRALEFVYLTPLRERVRVATVESEQPCGASGGVE